jgi:hypothetical protein
MSKNVPTLLGIIIILLVALLVIGVYNIMLANKMSEGGQMAGTKMTETLAGTATPTETTAPAAATAPETGTPAVKQATKPTAKEVPSVRRKGRTGKRAAAAK